MRRPLPVVGTVLAAAALALAFVALPVAAHVNQVNADPQVSANGTVLVENAGAIVDGFVVVHATTAGGEPGAVLGYVSVERNEFREAFTVEIDDQQWADWGDNRTVVVALHRDEGASEFDPTEDPIQRSFGSRVAERLELGKADAETSVAAERFERQQTATDSVTVERVAVGQPAVLAIRTDTDSPAVVGQRRLDPGVHHNVTVALAADTFTPDRRQRPLLATLYPAPANGSLDPGATPLRVGGAPIQTGFTVERTGSIATASDATAANATGNATAANATVTVTATPTPAGTEEPLVVTPSETATATPTTSPTTTGPATRTARGATTDASGPGFGLLGAALAILFAAHAFGTRADR